MKILVKKDNDQILSYFVELPQNREFNNLEMIEYMYNNPDTPIDFEYDGISEEEKNKIEKLYGDIRSIIIKKDDTEKKE